MPPSEIIAWKNLTDHVVTSDEYVILRAMDVTFCEETNKELKAYHDRQADENRQAIDAAQRGAR
jgi:accessory colonization factor AcfC